MNFSGLARACAAISFTALTAVAAHAANFTFSGNIQNNTDIVQIQFGLLADATNVGVWTDSFQSGVNFDPITALWHRVGSDYTLIGQNDDNPDWRCLHSFNRRSLDRGVAFRPAGSGHE